MDAFLTTVKLADQQTTVTSKSASAGTAWILGLRVIQKKAFNFRVRPKFALA